MPRCVAGYGREPGFTAECGVYHRVWGFTAEGRVYRQERGFTAECRVFGYEPGLPPSAGFTTECGASLFFRTPALHDIVTFRDPTQEPGDLEQIVFIKRIVAKAGDLSGRLRPHLGDELYRLGAL
ncbi:hypothetical protein ACLB2K_059761 [Fragaria x ananassa]